VLVRREDEGALAIGQLSHAWLSGQLARAWGNDRFTFAGPREEIALGAEQHDVGWAGFDLRPGLSADSGLPRSFLKTSVERHLEIWRPAPERLLSVSAHAALVVSLHGASLSELRLQGAQDGREALEAHVAAERARQAELCALLGLSERDTETIRRLMWTWDGLSLALCNAWNPFTARDVPAAGGLEDIELRRVSPGAKESAGGERDEGAFTLEPWPFAQERLEVRCEARQLAPVFEDEETMQSALERAAPVRLTFALAPAAD
jgi:hypothetical protein